MRVVQLGDLGELMQGLPHRFSPSRDPEQQEQLADAAVHLLNIGDIAGLIVTPPDGEPTRLLADAPMEKYTLREDDVLLTIRTRPFRAAVVLDAQPPMVPTQNLAVLRPRTDALHGPYLATYLKTPEAQSYIDGMYGQSATTPLLRLSSLAEMPIPLPTLTVQRRVADLALGFEEEEKSALAVLKERRALVWQSIATAIHRPLPSTPERLL